MLLNIRKFSFGYDDTIIVALSGGADSVCLLYVLLELRRLQTAPTFALKACHVNHKLRGKASDSDERFVRDLCAKLDVPLHVHEVDVKKQQKKHQSIEEAAREARYSYFSTLGTNVLIATAHTANDNAETVLLNLIRGTGLRGLCGIPPARDNIIRPLIEATRAEILAYLEEKNADYITDESNFSDEFTRNNLRLNIIPLLEKINPSFVTGVTRTCESLRHDEEYLHGLAEINDTCSVDLLLQKPPAIQNRIISHLLSKNNISPSFLRINSIVSLLETGGKINLSKDKFAIVSDNLLEIRTIRQNYRKN
jgi:tRNA(Ile)-lysidine synthase